MDIRMSNIASPMPQIRAKFTNKLGIPLSGCKVYTYEPNSDIPKTTWLDIDKTTENTNPILLDAAGEADIFLDGLYRVVVKDRFGFVVYDVEKTGTHTEWDASFVTYNGQTQKKINDGLESVAAMLAIGTPINGTRVYVKSYHAGLQKGGGWFVYDSSKSSVNDGGVTINGWVRQITDRVTPCMFGAYADDSTNDVEYIQAGINFAITHKKILDFEGRSYCVKKETYTPSLLQPFLTINGDIELVGNNATVRIDQSNAPAASKIMTLFQLLRKPEDLTKFTKSIGKIHIHGFNFDGGFDYDNEVDHATVQDTKKCQFLRVFEVIYDELDIRASSFRRFAQQNVITVGFSDQFKTYGLAKKTQISGNLFYDNGLLADMSTLYLMSDDTTVSESNRFEQPIGREQYCRCAIELHGTKAKVTGNTFKNMIAWVNLATHELENLAGEYIVTNNTGEAIESLARVWSGETTKEVALSEIIVSHNTVVFIDSAHLNVTNKNRALLGTGNFNKTFTSLIVSGNTVRTKTLSDTKPIYFVDIAVLQDWYTDISNIIVSGNAGYNMTGIASLGRHHTSEIDNCTFRNISIHGNSLLNTADAYIKVVTINQIDHPTVFVNNLNVYGNTISSTVNKLYWFVRGEGAILNVDIGLNIYNNKPLDGALVFAKAPLRLSTSQSLHVAEYGNIPTGRGAKIYSCKTEYLYESIPASLLTITGSTASVSIGVLLKGVRVKGARVKMPIGFSTVTTGVDNFNGYLSMQGDGASPSSLTDSVGLLDRPSPTMNFKINQDATWALIENKGITLNLTTNRATYLTNLKASGGNIEVELEVEKLI
ncbi:hypothetical protein [Acinetobacter towneri]|uniref:Uncharacterized protein n=1 Tax=Acinetobacter towneri TaxID=202956 RepID=A0AAP9KIX2_9GAMM|nr:hypothetical protein [Acinetobacter towneri]QGM27272.1 hypothetical protein GJD93_06090 [Acinetobacter towneri]